MIQQTIFLAMPGGWEWILIFLLLFIIFAIPFIAYRQGFKKGMEKQKLISEIEFLKKGKE